MSKCNHNWISHLDHYHCDECFDIKDRTNIIRITVLNDSWGGISRHADPDEEWDADSTWQEHSITGIEITKDGGDVAVGFTPLLNVEYYLLYVIFDTGDSFGSYTGQIEYIDLYEDSGIALENRNRIEKDMKTNPDNYSVELKHESGETYKFGTSWKGYFESLQTVEVVGVKL